MEAQAFTALLLSLVGTLFGLLVAVLSWIGNKIYTKLDQVNENLIKIDKDMTNKLSDIDKRVTRLEVAYSRTAPKAAAER
jgi:predicted PurR-regulated permease PerM